MDTAHDRRNRGRPPGAAAPVVVVERFIESIRESGYRNTPAAAAELVDNALDAGARRVSMRIPQTGRLDGGGAYLAVLDDGAGMDLGGLRQALQFGGSSRFASRERLGRFGMGLPNSSLSRARRLTLFSWRRPCRVLSSYLDVDELASGRMMTIPEPIPVTLPEPYRSEAGPHGTLVIWSQWDRFDVVYAGTLERQLRSELGRIFRYYLSTGCRISVNGKVVLPWDPLFLDPGACNPGARPWGGTLRYEVRIPGSRRISPVEVRFSELPVEAWYLFSNIEKGRRGITKGAGASIVRANREIDYGWFFLDGKRRENYDDWWRCEVRFRPELDELFGVTFTKQGIHPGEYLRGILSPEITGAARALNRRIRRRFQALGEKNRPTPSEAAASRHEEFLWPLAGHPSAGDRRLARRLGVAPEGVDGSKRFSILVRVLRDEAVLRPLRLDGRVVTVLNRDHPFHRKLYAPLVEGGARTAGMKKALELLLLALTRAELAGCRRERCALQRFRVEWSNLLAGYLGR